MLKLPILYENSSENLDTLGLGPMVGATEWHVTTERNAIPKLTMTYKGADYIASQIQNDRIIMVDASNQRRNQLFRINKFSKKVDDNGTKTIEIEATHVAGDIVLNSIKEDVSVANANPQQLWDRLLTSLSDGVPNFTFSSDIKSVANATFKWKEVSTLQDILFGAGTSSSDSFIKLYDGEWSFDNYHLYFNKRAGTDTGLVIKYGQNLKSLEQDEEITSMYTAIQPYATQKKTTTDTDANITGNDYEGVGLVQYLGAGGLPVYEKPNGNPTGQSVQNGQHIQLSKQYTDSDGNTWLLLTSGGWINGKHVVIDKKGAWISNKVIGKGHIKWNISSDGQGNIYETVNGVLVANYIYGNVPIYSEPTSDSVQKGYLNKSIARWKVFYKTKDSNGVTWYDLGNNQWVSNRYVQFDKESTYTYSPGRGVGTVNHDTKNKKGQYEGVAIWDTPSYSGHVVKYVYHNQRYQIFQVANNNGKTWYNLGGNQWIDGGYMQFDKNDRDVKPKTDSELGNDGVPTPRYSGKVVIYDKPGYGQKPTGGFLYSGDEVNIISQASTSNGTWYEVGENQWVNGSYINFGDDNTDVDPYDPSKDIIVKLPEQKEVTITLPEVYVKSDNADKFEHLKIQKVDLSQYNIDTEEKLREVAKAYIYDNRIGEPTTSLTVNYYQMRGELAALTDVDVNDIGTVFFPQFDINVSSEVVSGKWNGRKYRWDEITFGKKPESLRDTLDKYLYTADTNTKTQVNDAKAEIGNSLDIKWYKFHEDTTKDLLGLQTEFGKQYDTMNENLENSKKEQQVITQKMIDDATKKYNENVNSAIQELSNVYVSKASLTGGALTYEKDKISARTRSGGQFQLSSEGLVITDRYGHNNVAVSGEDGSVALAHDIVGKEIVGYSIKSANIMSGTIEAGVQIKSPMITGGQIDAATLLRSTGYYDGANQYTVMSAENGFSTTQGLQVRKTSNLYGETNIYGGLFANNGCKITGNLHVVGQIFVQYGGIQQIVFKNNYGDRGYIGFWDDGRFVANKAGY